MGEPLNPLDKAPGLTAAPASSGGSMANENVAGAQPPSSERLLACVFEGWNKAGIPFVILRNYERLPAAASNDIDVLVEPGQFAAAERALITSAQAAGYRLHNRIEFASIVFFFYHPESLHQIQFDLYAHLSWRGLATLPVDAVLARRITRGMFAIPHPVHEAAISLLNRLLQHGVVGDKYKPGILSAFTSEPRKAIEILSRPFGAAPAQTLVDRALTSDWAGVEELTRALRRALCRRSVLLHPVQTLMDQARELARFFRRLFRPAGMTLVILGADGSGKSTVADRAIENLRPTFSPGKGLRLHWKPVVFFPRRRQTDGRPNLDPHGRPPRGRVASHVYLVGHWLEFLLGSQLQFRPVLFRGGLVLIDRYFYDFLVDQRRYRLQVPLWMVRALFAFSKRPDLVFLLDAQPEVLQARKQEVSPVETGRQVEAYRNVVEALPQGRRLDASQPADKVATELTCQTLDWLYARQRNRGPG